VLRFEQIEKMGLIYAGIIRRDDWDGNPLTHNTTESINSVLNSNGIYPKTIYRVNQQHSDNICIVENEYKKTVVADGIITQIPGIALCILVADCVPIFLFDPTKTVLGVIHAGREGTRKQIAVKAVGIFVNEFNSNPDDIVSIIGPSIGPCCYNLPDELLNLCSHDGLVITDKHTVDLWQSNKKQLLDSGLSKSKIFISEECTCCSNYYYSYRRGDRQLRNYAIGMI